MTEENLATKQSILGKCGLFSSLDGSTTRRLAERAKFRNYSAGHAIFRAGSHGESMMIIAQGAVRISAMAPTARDVILTELHHGDAFGEIALLDGRGRSADAHAHTNCRLLILERRDLLEVMQAQPRLAITMLELVCARLRRSDDRMMEFAFLGLPARLARVVLSLSEGTEVGNVRPLPRLAQSQSELADMVGSSRENLNRCLRQWKQDGLIELNDGWILLIDRAGLEKIAKTE